MNPEISLPPSRALYRGDREMDNIQARNKRKREEEEKGRATATGILPSDSQQDTAMHMVEVQLPINSDNKREHGDRQPAAKF